MTVRGTPEPETARMRVVATAGHVDHGKTTLLRTLTGMEPDRWEQERARGLTIDLGFVWTDLLAPDGTPRTIAFVDVPGHERFVTNMLAGAGAVELALFVVAADDGWNAQSQEHLEILDVLGVGAVAVAVTKAGTVGPDRVRDVADDTARRFAGTSLDGAPIVVTDALAGSGIDELRDVLVRRLDATPPPHDADRTRLWVDRSFTVSGAGTVVTGTLAGGMLAVGDELTLHPPGTPVRVRGMQSLGRAVGAAAPGSRVALNLVGVDHADVTRGQALVRRPDGAWHATDVVAAWVRPLPGREVTARGDWHLHVGSLEVRCRVAPLLGSVDASAPGPVRLDLPLPVPLQHGDRFVLRESGTRRTVAGGTVLDPRPGPRPRGVAERLDRAEVLEGIADATTPCELLGALVDTQGGHRRRDDTVAAAGLAGVPPCDDPVLLGSWLVRAARLPMLLAATEEAVAAADPAVGAPLAAVREHLRVGGCPPDLCRSVLDHAVSGGRLVRHDEVLVLPAGADAYEHGRRERQDAFVATLAVDPLQPPDADTAARELGLQPAELRELVEQRLVVRAGPVVFAGSAVDVAVGRLRVARPDGAPFTASEARELWATSRKFALPLLEHLAATGVTAFDGSHHRLREADDPGPGTSS